MPAAVGFHVFPFIGLATRTPQLVHISVRGVVGAPQPGQKVVPAIGLAPQFIQISGVPANSFPQLLQNTAYLRCRHRHLPFLNELVE
jgi:hypothetical protein